MFMLFDSCSCYNIELKLLFCYLELIVFHVVNLVYFCSRHGNFMVGDLIINILILITIFFTLKKKHKASRRVPVVWTRRMTASPDPRR